MDPETGVFLALLGGFVVAACICLVPATVAGLRSHPKRWPVFLINLLSGGRWLVGPRVGVGPQEVSRDTDRQEFPHLGRSRQQRRKQNPIG